MRLLPFLKPTKGVQIAGGGFPDSGGGGGSYTLPPATDTTLGGVKIGSGVNVTSDGTISVNGGGSYTLPPATSETLGGIKVGSRLSVESDGTLSATDQSYTLPTASASTLGGVKVGSGLSITDGVLSATGGSGGWTLEASYTVSSNNVAYRNAFNYLMTNVNVDTSKQYRLRLILPSEVFDCVCTHIKPSNNILDFISAKTSDGTIIYIWSYSISSSETYCAAGYSTISGQSIKFASVTTNMISEGAIIQLYSM